MVGWKVFKFHQSLSDFKFTLQLRPELSNLILSNLISVLPTLNLSNSRSFQLNFTTWRIPKIHNLFLRMTEIWDTTLDKFYEPEEFKPELNNYDSYPATIVVKNNICGARPPKK